MIRNEHESMANRPNSVFEINVAPLLSKLLFKLKWNNSAPFEYERELTVAEGF